MANGAPQNFAEHVATAVIGRDYSVADQKSSRSGVVGNDTQGNIDRGIETIIPLGNLRCLQNERL